MEANREHSDKNPERRKEIFKTHREETYMAGKQLIGLDQVDTLQVVAQQYATVAIAVEDGRIVENRNERQGKRHSLCGTVSSLRAGRIRRLTFNGGHDYSQHGGVSRSGDTG